jgi:hypothetical protein
MNEWYWLSFSCDELFATQALISGWKARGCFCIYTRESARQVVSLNLESNIWSHFIFQISSLSSRSLGPEQTTLGPLQDHLPHKPQDVHCARSLQHEEEEGRPKSTRRKRSCCVRQSPWKPELASSSTSFTGSVVWWESEWEAGRNAVSRKLNWENREECLMAIWEGGSWLKFGLALVGMLDVEYKERGLIYCWFEAKVICRIRRKGRTYLLCSENPAIRSETNRHSRVCDFIWEHRLQ